MTPASKASRTKNRGTVLIISMIFVVIFSALAVSMAAMSGTNLQIAENHRKADHARACAESGFDVIRFWLSRVSISGTTADDLKFSQIAGSLQDELTSESITNVTTSCNGSVITIPSVTLNSQGQERKNALKKADRVWEQVKVEMELPSRLARMKEAIDKYKTISRLYPDSAEGTAARSPRV